MNNLADNKIPSSQSLTRRILIVDDDRNFAKGLANVLILQGHKVFLADSQSQARQLLEQHAFDISLIDIRLRNTNGLSLVSEFKTHHPQILCVMVTGYSSVDTAIDALQAGAFDYLNKPIQKQALLRTLDRCFEHIDLERASIQAEQKFRDLLESSPDAMVITNQEDEIVLINLQTERLFDYSRDKLLGSPIKILMSDNTWVKYKEHRAWYLTHSDQLGVNHGLDLSGKTRAGRVFPAEISLSTLNTDEGRLVSTVIRDITERKLMEKRLSDNEARYRFLYHEHPSMMFTVDTDGVIVNVNQYGADQLGYSWEQLIGMPAVNLFYHDDRQAAQQALTCCLDEKHSTQRWELRKECKNGELIWVRETARVVIGTEGKPVILIVCEDITEAHALSDQLRNQAQHDYLTNLVSRREFERRLDRLLESTDAERSEHGLCYLDLDHFKIINDTCGHMAGDELLRQLAQLMRKQTRQRDTLARLGGDEFAVLLEHCSLEQVVRIGEGLRSAIAEFVFLWNDKTFNVTVSVGVVAITANSGNKTETFKHADLACYAAKNQGGNNLQVYQEHDKILQQQQDKMIWVNRIKDALEYDRFFLVAQPIATLDGIQQAFNHFELLIRISDEDKGFLLPSQFIPAAEHFGLAIQLDKWVVRKALNWLARHRHELNEFFLCSINLSGHSIGNKHFIDFIHQQFDESGIAPAMICFEITETATIANLAHATHFIENFKKIGCRFSLDDFGSGLSSFAYLKKLPVDFLKIDGCFVKDIVDNPIDRAMVRSIHDIGHLMGIKTIAEFAENQAILDILKEIGVDFAQGYAVSQPQPLPVMLA